MAAIRKARPSGPLPTEFIQLIQTDPAARHQLIGMLAETFAQRTDLQAVLDRIDAQGEQIKAQGERIETLTEQIKAQGERIETLAEQIKAQGERIETLAEQIKAQGERIETLTEQIKAQGERIKAQGERIETLAEQIKAQGEQIKAQGERIETLAEQIKAQGERIETLQLDFNRQFAALTRRMDQFEQRMERFDQRQVQFEERQDTFEKSLKRLEWSVNALGARWGLMAEEAFRAGLESILSAETGRIVERYLKMDTAGMVFGRPDQVEMDVVIHNGAHILIEIKSSVSRDEARLFARKVDFYEQEEGVTARRRIIITPMLDPRAKPLVEELGLEVYTSAFDVTL